jgi:hypothetical protein
VRSNTGTSGSICLGRLQPSGAWTVEEEKMLVSTVETFGTTSWADIAANVPGRNEIQCCSKWVRMSKKAATTSSGTWMLEEEMKLV